MIIFLATLAGMPAPLTVIQLLWLNLLTDGAPALALAMEKGDPAIMDRQPRPPSEPIINKTMRLGITIQTITQTGVVLGAFMVGLLWHLEAGALDSRGDEPITYCFSTIGAAWTCRRRKRWRSSRSACASCSGRTRCARSGCPSSSWASSRISTCSMQLAYLCFLLILVVSVPFLQPIFNTHFPILREWGVIFGFAMVPAIVEEITKLYLRWKDRRDA